MESASDAFDNLSLFFDAIHYFPQLANDIESKSKLEHWETNKNQ